MRHIQTTKALIEGCFSYECEIAQYIVFGKGKIFSLVAIMILMATKMATLDKVLDSSLLMKSKPKIELSRVPKLVMAFYHNWYGSVDGPCGQWMHWDSVIWITNTMQVIGKHDPNNFSDPNRRDIGATNYPLKGLYDSRDPDIIRWHIKLARETGIDVFVVDWWGDTSREDISDVNMKVMMDINEKEDLGMQFCILFDGLWVQPQPPSLDETIARLEYAIKKYGNRTSYLKLEGSPVIFTYSTQVYSANIWSEIINKVRNDGYSALFFSDAFSEEYADVFDGLQNYAPPGLFEPNQDFTKAYKTVAQLAKNRNEPYGFDVMPGYDDTKVRQPGRILSRENGATYKKLWEAVLSSGSQWALVTSWNEWHEGTEIEPSIEHGYRYIELTKKYSRIFKKR
jgi:glycoprotein endo-alpha-1,2-mannosidase